MAVFAQSRAQSVNDSIAKPIKSDSVNHTETVVAKPIPVDSIKALADTSNLDSLKLHTKEKPKYRHSPTKAALFSAVLPGLGQAYNKKYWKIPIVYAGFGGLGYALYYTSTNFNGFRQAYRAQVATVPNSYASYLGVEDAATLKEYRDYFKKYLDISAIATGVWYLLNIVDAAVDAHLMEWNMRDDLSVAWHPVVLTGGPYYASAAPGIGITVGF